MSAWPWTWCEPRTRIRIPVDPLQDNWGKQFGFRCWFRRRFQSPATKVPFSESGLREGDFRFAATKVPFSEVGFLRGQKRPPIWDKPQTGEFARRLPGYGESECGRRCGCGFEVSYPWAHPRIRQPPSHITPEDRPRTPTLVRLQSRGGSPGRGCRRRREDAARCCRHLPGPSHP